MNYIPLGQCKHGYLYKIAGRNLDYGVFNEKDNGFIGIRTKFESRYLFTEYHWDTTSFATVQPLEEIEKVPDGITINEDLIHAMGDLWAENPETGKIEAVLRKSWVEFSVKDLVYIIQKGHEESPHGEREGFADYWVRTEKRLPDNLYPYTIKNKELFKYLDESP